MAKAREPKLTPKQNAFCLHVAQGRSQSDAYRLIYDASKMKPESVTTAASILAANEMVADRISVLSSRAAARATNKTAYTLEAAILEAEDIRHEALADGNQGAAVSAATLKAKLAGHLVERKEVRSGPLEEADIA